MSKKTDEKKIKDMTTDEKRALIENWKDNLTPEERETARELAEMIGSFRHGGIVTRSEKPARLPAKCCKQPPTA